MCPTTRNDFLKMKNLLLSNCIDLMHRNRHQLCQEWVGDLSVALQPVPTDKTKVFGLGPSVFQEHSKRSCKTTRIGRLVTLRFHRTFNHRLLPGKTST